MGNSSGIKWNGVSEGAQPTLDVVGANLQLIVRDPKTQQEWITTSQDYANFLVDNNIIPSGGYWDASGNDIFNNNSGNVGVGINSPTHKLEVIGDLYAEFTDDTLQHRIIATSAADNNITTQFSVEPTGFQISANDYTNGTYAQISGSSFDNAVTLQGGDGNVGIGTYTPTAKLSVIGDVIAIVTSDTLEHTFTAISSADNNISSYIYVNSFATALVSNNLTDATNSSIEVNASAGINITSNTSPTTIQPPGNSGNVGIGTTTPTSKLTVDTGDIEVVGDTNGVILESPDGTRYRVTVANGGTLNVVAV